MELLGKALLVTGTQLRRGPMRFGEGQSAELGTLPRSGVVTM